jgi:predicted NAD/FAD-binding protein
MRARADTGDKYAATELTRLLAERGDLDQALQILRAQANVGYGDAGQLADLLTQQETAVLHSDQRACPRRRVGGSTGSYTPGSPQAVPGYPGQWMWHGGR